MCVRIDSLRPSVEEFSFCVFNCGPAYWLTKHCCDSIGPLRDSGKRPHPFSVRKLIIMRELHAERSKLACTSIPGIFTPCFCEHFISIYLSVRGLKMEDLHVEICLKSVWFIMRLGKCQTVI